MYRLLIIYFLCLWSIINSSSFGFTVPTFFIINGMRAVSGQFPYLVSIRVEGAHNCGGAIIDRRWILTAAHCASDDFDIDSLSVVAGSATLFEEGDRYSVEVKIPHIDWDSHANINDIALLKVDRDIELSPNRVAIIPLADKDALIPPGANVTVAGWGYTQYPSSQASNHLMYTHVNVVEQEDCKRQWATQTVITRNHLCVHNDHHHGTCLGDSGGPYIYNGHVIGVHIFGDWCKFKKPSVATRLSGYYSWIQEKMNLYL